MGEILSLETGGMGAGGRSGSRQGGGWNPGPLPSSHGQERLFQRFLGNQVYSPNAAGWPPKMVCLQPIIWVFVETTICLDPGVNKKQFSNLDLDWIRPLYTVWIQKYCRGVDTQIYKYSPLQNKRLEMILTYSYIFDCLHTNETGLG